MKKFLVGVVSGIVAGLFFAPKSGKKMRNELKNSDDKINYLLNSFSEFAKDASQEAKIILNSEEFKKVVESSKNEMEKVFNYLDEKRKNISQDTYDEVTKFCKDIFKKK